MAGCVLSDIYWVKKPICHCEKLDVSFVPIQSVVCWHERACPRDLCRDLLDIIGRYFHSKENFLAVWQHVRYVAYIHKYDKPIAMAVVSGAICWHIDYVVVEQQHRDKGYARSLLKKIETEAGIRHIPFMTLVSNESLRPFYSKCGFTEAKL